MASVPPMSNQVAIAVNDLLDNCARIQPGQQVLIVAATDGLYGGANIVDELTVTWIQSGVQQRGAHPSVLWVDVVSQPHAWQVPPVLKAALGGCDIFINHAFDLPWEELYELRETATAHGVPMVRNMATTAPLLTSTWAQTPYELVSEIRFQVGAMFSEGLPWTLTHPNGTNLKGTIGPPIGGFSSYTERRIESLYRPFPEGVFPPMVTPDTEGTLVFTGTSSWWSRYIGVPPSFNEPVRLTIEGNRIIRFEGGEEAEALRRFMEYLASRLDEMVYQIVAFHGGVHPQAKVSPHQCPDSAYREFIHHHHAGSLHFHLGNSPYPNPHYPYMLHITGEIQGVTLEVGESLVYDGGHLTALDHPQVQAIVARYPHRPGLTPGL